MTIDDAGTSDASQVRAATVDAVERTSDPARTRRPGSAPGWLVWVMIVLASAIAIGASFNAWLNRELLDTDNWVEVSEEVLADPAVREALSVYLVDELFAYVDVSAQLEDRLPDSLQVLAGPISQALRQPAIDGVDRLLASPKVQAAWSEANRLAHQSLVRILKDETRDGVSTTDGVVTLQLGTLVYDLGTQLGLPTAVLDRIPPDAGTFIVAESDQLKAAQDAVKYVEVLSVVLLLLVIVLYVAAVFVASDRRAALRNVGIALSVSGLLVLLGRWFAINYVTDSIEKSDSIESAARSIAIIGTGILNELAWTGVAIGLVIFTYALLVGPTHAAFALRRGLSPILVHRFGAWLLALAILALVVLITPGTGAQTWLGRGTLLILLIVGVERLHRLAKAEHADTSFSKVAREAGDWFSSDSTSTAVTTPTGD